MANDNNHKSPYNANGNSNSKNNYNGSRQNNKKNNYNNKNNNKQQNNALTNETAESSKANIGWLFYRDYFRGIEGKNANDLKEHFLQMNKKIEGSRYDSSNSSVYKIFSNRFNVTNLKTFDLEVCPPGLLIGSGMLHGVPGDGDYQLGLQFDHTSGLPIIPGSSIKGLLRSMFPKLNKKKDDNGKIIYEHDNNRINYIIDKLNEITHEKIEEQIKKQIKKIDDAPHTIELLTQRLFKTDTEKNEGDNNGVKYPIFMDAIIVGGDKYNKILGSDYITPHHDAFKDPVPIKFLKVLPGVKFRFFFSIPSEIKIGELKLNQDNIRELFKLILQDVGVGAKTNVGYGHLKEIEQQQN